MSVVDIARVRREPVCIIGAGPAGLITAHILLQDGFENVQVISQDSSVGGVWSRERVYPTMNINNVYGQFRFSALEMAPPPNAQQTGGRLTGNDICTYMEQFADKFLKGRIRFNTEVLDIRRGSEARGWTLRIKNREFNAHEELHFPRIVLCTGGCSTPKFPNTLTPAAAVKVGFRGPVVHSSESWTKMNTILSSVRPAHPENNVSGIPNSKGACIVIIGGGKSAQDTAAYLANEKCKVTVVYQKADMFLAAPKPLPNYIRQSRLLSILSPSIELRTRTERFLHTTWLGGKITRRIWDTLAENSFKAYSVPENSPLRLAHSIFWGNRTGDEGLRRENSYQDLVNKGEIKIIAPAQVTGFGDDGSSLLLSNGQRIQARAVVVATGYSSSWDNLFDESVANDIGLTQEANSNSPSQDKWDYASMANPPVTTPHPSQREPSVYKGLVPANNIFRRDLAVNGAMITNNAGYAFELCAHWISSYFLGDPMRLPTSVDEAVRHAKRNVAWMKTRFPDSHSWTNASYGSASPYFSWPQAMDDLFEDMYLPSMRSGGNWFTWPIQPISIDELSTLREERETRRRESKSS